VIGPPRDEWGHELVDLRVSERPECFVRSVDDDPPPQSYAASG
jgi:hypothetical protein